MLRKHNRYLYPGWAVRLLFHSRNVNKPVIDHHFLCCIKIFASLRCKAFIQFQVFTAKLYVTTQLPSSEFIQGTGNQCSLFFVEVTIFRDSTNRAWQAWHFTINFYERVCLLPDCQPFLSEELWRPSWLLICNRRYSHYFFLDCCSWLYNLLLTPEFLQIRTLRHGQLAVSRQCQKSQL